jgi:mRNA interferase RelE/StbE
VTYKVVILPAPLEMLRRITDRRVRGKIFQLIEDLAEEPEKRGKPLSDELQGYWSLRAAAQRYRVIYRIENQRVEVIVIAVGLRRAGDRKDAYEIARKLVRLRLA